jgi:hypothetical protein
VRPGIGGWRAEELKAGGPVKDPDDVEVREAFDIRQARLEDWLDLEQPLRVVLRAGPLGDLRGLGVGAGYVADGPNREGISVAPVSSRGVTELRNLRAWRKSGALQS